MMSFIAGFFVGGLFGVFIMSLVQISRWQDDHEDF